MFVSECLVMMFCAAASDADIAAAAKARRLQADDVALTIHIKSTRYRITGELVLEYDEMLYLKGGLVRLESRQPLMHTHRPGKYVRKLQIDIANESEWRDFWPEGIDTSDRPSGIIGPKEELTAMKTAKMIPLALHFRGDVGYLNIYKIGDLPKTGTLRDIEGHSCRSYECSYRDGMIHQFWFDLQSGVLRKFENHINQVLRCDLSVHYESREGLPEVPVRWTMVSFDDRGKAEFKEEIELTKIASPAGNPNSLFVLDFPPGTEVSDTINHEDYRLSQSGEKEFLHEAVPKPEPIPHSALEVFWIAATMIAIILGYVVQRFWRGRKRIDQPAE